MSTLFQIKKNSSQFMVDIQMGSMSLLDFKLWLFRLLNINTLHTNLPNTQLRHNFFFLPQIKINSSFDSFSSPHRFRLKYGKCDFRARESNQMICMCTICLRTGTILWGARQISNGCVLCHLFWIIVNIWNLIWDIFEFVHLMQWLFLRCTSDVVVSASISDMTRFFFSENWKFKFLELFRNVFFLVGV